MKDDGLEYLLSLLPQEPDRSCALHLLPYALDFVREAEGEFGTARLQKHLKTGYGKTVKVIDALIALCVLEIAEEKPRKYKRLCERGEISHDIYYNAYIYEDKDESHSAWDPSLFRTEEEALNYAKAAYGDAFATPIYVISRVSIKDGWDVIEEKEHREG